MKRRELYLLLMAAMKIDIERYGYVTCYRYVSTFMLDGWLINNTGPIPHPFTFSYLERYPRIRQ